MATGKVNTRNWTAKETTDFAGRNRKLTVSGEVEVRVQNQTPQLREKVPQGINPKILILELTITSEGGGGDVLTWKPVSFERHVSQHQYESVEIEMNGQQIASVKVQVIPS